MKIIAFPTPEMQQQKRDHDRLRFEWSTRDAWLAAATAMSDWQIAGRSRKFTEDELASRLEHFVDLDMELRRLNPFGTRDWYDTVQNAQ